MKKAEQHSQPVLLVSREVVTGGEIVTLTLNRPSRLNSLTHDLISLLVSAINTEAANPTPRVVIVTVQVSNQSPIRIIYSCRTIPHGFVQGAGRAFSAGVDLNAAASLFKLDATDGSQLLPLPLDAVAAVRACPHPVVACVAGACFTGGLELALSCDVLLAAADAQFADTHAKVGLAPSWGMSQELPRLVGVHRALEMSLSARPIDAATAERWGLCARVVPSLGAPTDPGGPAVVAAGRDLACAILSNHTPMVRAYKKTVHEGLALPKGEALARERSVALAYYQAMTAEDAARLTAVLTARKGKIGSGQAHASKL
jgi:enoyl-CoA hydratase